MQYFSAELVYSNETLNWENNDFEGVFLVCVNDDYFNDFIDEYGMGRY